MQKTTLSLGFSTCPNDTFIFEALVNNRFEVEGLELTTYLTDVEELNQKAFTATYDITKLSTFAYSQLSDQYQILDSGSALGTNNGPLLISNKKINIYQIEKYNIAIPGKNTTANFLLTALYPQIQNKTEMLFSDIEDAIVNGDVDAGVIIHESRFTYQQKGLQKVIDLGQRWERRTGLPVPLGCIAIKRNLPDEIKIKVNNAIKKSIEVAFANPEQALSYCKQYANTMTNEIMLQHIVLYVNKYSLSLGDEGKEAINTLYEFAQNMGMINNELKEIFVS